MAGFRLSNGCSVDLFGMFSETVLIHSSLMSGCWTACIKLWSCLMHTWGNACKHVSMHVHSTAPTGHCTESTCRSMRIPFMTRTGHCTLQCHVCPGFCRALKSCRNEDPSYWLLTMQAIINVYTHTCLHRTLRCMVPCVPWLPLSVQSYSSAWCPTSGSRSSWSSRLRWDYMDSKHDYRSKITGKSGMELFKEFMELTPV